MSQSQFGALVGAILAIVLWQLGFFAFLLTGIFMLLGTGIAKYGCQKLDLSAALKALLRRNNTTSD